MGSLLLATEHGIGLNFDILETNVINLAIIIGVLYVYGGKFVKNLMNERRNRIEEEITSAEERAKVAEGELQKAQTALAQAQATAANILSEAKVTAERLRSEILAQADGEIARLQADAGKELASEREKVIAELKRQIAVQALARVETELKNRMSQGQQQEQFVDRCIAQIGGDS